VRPLVDALALLLERTYDTGVSLVPVGRFIVGDEGYRRLVAGRRVRQKVAHSGAGARLLLRPLEEGGSWAVALYLPDDLVEHLEREDPRRTLHAGNVDAFATLVEEIDHLVTFADRAAHGGPELTLLELEWHAGVSKYLVLAHFLGRLAGGRPLGAEERAFLLWHLFHKGEWAEPDPDVRARYEDATRLALRFVEDLGTRPPTERIRRLRRFHHASHHEKLRRFAS